MLWNNQFRSYLGATTPAPGSGGKSYIWGNAKWAESCYFRFIHAYEDRVYIEHGDSVRIEILTGDEKPIGKLRNMPPMGSNGTSGDIFIFRYLNPFP